MNKAELIDAIAKHADISKAAAGRALDAAVNTITSSLKKGDIVTLVGFGSFYIGEAHRATGTQSAHRRRASRSAPPRCPSSALEKPSRMR